MSQGNIGHLIRLSSKRAMFAPYLVRDEESAGMYVFLTENGGANWEKQYVSDTWDDIYFVPLVTQFSPNTVLIQNHSVREETARYAWVSTDRGHTWETKLWDELLASLIVMIADDEGIAIDRKGRLLKIGPEFETWRNVIYRLDIRDAGAIALLAPSLATAVTDRGNIAVSADNGNSWRKIFYKVDAIQTVRSL